MSSTTPTHMLVPVGILQRAGQIADALADRQRDAHPDASADDYLPGNGPDDHDRWARAFYGASRGEPIDWTAVLDGKVPDTAATRATEDDARAIEGGDFPAPVEEAINLLAGYGAAIYSAKYGREFTHAAREWIAGAVTVAVTEPDDEQFATEDETR